MKLNKPLNITAVSFSHNMTRGSLTWVEIHGTLVRFFVTLGHKILISFRIKVLFEADIIKG